MTREVPAMPRDFHKFSSLRWLRRGAQGQETTISPGYILIFPRKHVAVPWN